MRNKSGFVTAMIASVILISGCVLGSSLDTGVETAEGTEEPEYGEIVEGDEYEYGEHGFIQAPGDYWTPVELPDISDAERREYCRMTSSEWREYYAERLEEATQLSDELEEYILD